MKAWNAGKLGRALAKAGLDSRALRVALAGSEDALTSSVLGRISYLPTRLQRDALEGAAPRPLMDRAWPEFATGEPEWEFWPGYPPPRGGSGRRVEPDAVVSWGELTVVIEAKHRGHQYAGQWVRQLRAVRDEDGVPPQNLVLLAVGGHSPEWDRGRAEQVSAATDLLGVGVFRVTWSSLHTSLQRLRTRPELDAGLRVLVSDACEALAGSGHSERLGVWSLPTAVNFIGAVGPGHTNVYDWRVAR